MRAGLSTVSARIAGASGGILAPERFLDLVERIGPRFLLLDGAMPPGYFDSLRPLLDSRRNSLPVRAVENVFPADRADAASLAALDRSEAKAAVDAARKTIRVAAELGAEWVLLRLGEVEGAKARWPLVRRAWLRGELDEDDTPCERLKRDRAGHAPRHIDALRRSLDELGDAADRAGVRLGLRNPVRPIGLPSPIELRMLVDDLRGAPLAPAFDSSAAHLADTMGLGPFAETLAAWSKAPVALLADACGPVAGLPPGRGEVDIAAVVGALSEDALAVFVPGRGLDEEEVREGYARVAALVAARVPPTS